MKPSKHNFLLATGILGAMIIIGCLGIVKKTQAEMFEDNFDAYTAGNDLDTENPLWVDYGAYSCPKVATTSYSSSPNSIYNAGNLRSCSRSGDWQTEIDFFSYAFNIVASSTGTYHRLLMHGYSSSTNDIFWKIWFDVKETYADMYNCHDAGDANCDLVYTTIALNTWHTLQVRVNVVGSSIQYNLGDNWSGHFDAYDEGLNEYDTLRFHMEGALIYLDTVGSSTWEYENEPGVTIIELDPFDGDVEIMSEMFAFPSEVYCQISTTCEIKIWYSEDDVGSEVYLLLDGTEDLDDYDDFIVLEDKPLMYDYVYPNIQSTEQELIYNYFVYNPVTGSSTLYQETKVYWVTTITDEMEDSSSFSMIWGALRRIFPLSLMFQIYDIFNYITLNEADQDYFVMDLTDWLSDEADAITGTSSVILSKAILSDNTTWWDEYIIDKLSALIYIINFVFIGFLLFPKDAQDK